MIIAAYAGTGKTTFAAEDENAIDLWSMPYTWIFPYSEEHESEKAAQYLLRNPLYHLNYIVDILRAETRYDYVFIPTSIAIIECLQEEFGRTVLLCYPEDGLQTEYYNRFVARGNSGNFLSLFVGGWRRFLQPVHENAKGIHLPMKSGEYLTDLRSRFDAERAKDTTEAVSEETIAKLEKSSKKRRRILYYICHAK